MILAERLRTGADIANELMEVHHQIDLLQLKACRLAAEFDASGFWEDEGSNNAIDWIRFNCRLTSNAAADRIAVGRRAGDLAQSIQAVESDQIGYAHLTVMARTANAVGKAFDETKLLKLARENSPGKFHYKCMHYRHSVDAQGYAAEQAELADNRRLSLSTAQDGCLLISGVLDPVGGAAVRTALEPLARPSGEHDNRLLEQRYADALVELAHGGKPANLQITASVETVKALTGAPGAEMEFSLPIASQTVERMACDCSVMRILLDQQSVVVDVGRAKRVISGPARRALKARDGHCQWPGCERPAAWCDGHPCVRQCKPTDLLAGSSEPKSYSDEGKTEHDEPDSEDPMGQWVVSSSWL
jgi:Domain of unknown function (DUF222)